MIRFILSVAVIGAALLMPLGAAELSSTPASAHTSTLAPALVAILDEAEAAGLPVAAGEVIVGAAHLPGGWSGTVAPGDLLGWHLKSPDGGLMLELVLPAPAGAASGRPWQPADARSGALVWNTWRYGVLRHIRAVRLGFGRWEGDLAADYARWSASQVQGTWPRDCRGPDLATVLRWQCRSMLLDLALTRGDARLAAAAVRLAPVGWAEATTEALARGRAAGVVDPQARLARSTEAELLAAIADPAPAPWALGRSDPPAVGDMALTELGRRWGLDPVVLVDPASLDTPWDNAARRRTAEALTTWRTAQGSEPWAPALARVVTHLGVARTLAVLENCPPWTQALAGDPPRAWAGSVSVVASAVATQLVATPELSPADFTRLVRHLGSLSVVAQAITEMSATGALAWARADYLAGQGDFAEIDRLVEAALATGPGPRANAALGRWMSVPTPKRWQRIVALAAGSVSDPATLAVLAQAGRSFATARDGRASPMAMGLAVRALRDQRLLPPQLKPEFEARSGSRPLEPWRLPGMTVADLTALAVAKDLRRLAGPQFVMGGELVWEMADPQSVWGEGLVLDAAPSDRQAARNDLLDKLAPLAADALSAAGLDEAWVPSDGPKASLVSETSAQSLRALLAEAAEAGLPSLNGAVFAALRGHRYNRRLPDLRPFAAQLRFGDGTVWTLGQPFRSWDGALLNLPSGVWVPLDRTPVLVAEEVWRYRIGVDPIEASRERRSLPAFFDAVDVALVAALVTWAEGRDPDGGVLLTGLRLDELARRGPPLVLRPPTEVRFSDLPMDNRRTGPLRPGEPVRACRRALAWLVAESLPASGEALKARLALARQLAAPLPEADRAELEAAIVERRPDQAGTPRRLPHPRQGLTLEAARILTHWDPEHGGLPTLPEALDVAACLAGDAPVGWWQGRFQRRQPEVALAAYAVRWGFDPRWAVRRDPAVARVLAKETGGNLEPDRLWQEVQWSPALRQVVLTAFRAFIAGGGEDRLATVLRDLPERDVLDIALLGPPPPRLLAATKQYLSQLEAAPTMKRERQQRRWAPVLLRWDVEPRAQAGNPWLRQIAALKEAKAGKPEALDQLFAEAMDVGDLPPWDQAAPTHPRANLGIWLQTDDQAKRDRLKRLLSQAPGVPLAEAVMDVAIPGLSQLGNYYNRHDRKALVGQLKDSHPVLARWGRWLALGDQRTLFLDEAVRQSLMWRVSWQWQVVLPKEPLRVADLMAVLMLYDQDGIEGRRAADFAALPPVQRDKTIYALREGLRPELAATGLTVPALAPSGAPVPP
jgi:hypothetical protein